MGKKVKVLVLSGGGANGIYQIGVLDSLVHSGEDIKYDLVAGTSAGALNGSFIASGEYMMLRDLWQKALEGHKFIDMDVLNEDSSLKPFMLPRLIYRLLKKRYILSNDKLKEVLDESLKLDKIKNTGRFVCNAVSLSDKKNYIFDSEYLDTDEELADAVLSSTSIPVYFPSVNKVSFRSKSGVKLYAYDMVDGGVWNSSPLSYAVSICKDMLKQDPTLSFEFTLVYCHDPNTAYEFERPNNIVQDLGGVMRMVLDASATKDLEMFELKNKISAQTGGDYYNYFESRIISPTSHLNSSYDFSPGALSDTYKKGFDDGLSYFKNK